MKVFVFAYYSIKDPVFVSATLNYLIEATKSNDSLKFYLLTFEHSGFPIPESEIDILERDLANRNIYWKRSVWRTGGLMKPFLKFYDLIKGIGLGMKIIKQNQCDLIFSEGVVGASISYFISKLTKKPHLIHSFEPHADAMKEGKIWASSSWEYRLLKHFEKRLAKSAVTLITGTEAYVEVIKNLGATANIFVIPSCVQTEEFKFDAQSRFHLRNKYSITTDEIVLVYLGKFGGMYMEKELFQFFKNCELNKELNFRYWIFSVEDHHWINEQFEFFDIPKSKTLVSKLSKSDVPRYLSAADVGIVAVRPLPSKRYCSPIKTGEYWACGLPILVPNGVGDDYVTVTENPSLGIAVDKLERFCLINKLARVDEQSLCQSRSLSNHISKWIDALNATISME